MIRQESLILCCHKDGRVRQYNFDNVKWADEVGATFFKVTHFHYGRVSMTYANDKLCVVKVVRTPINPVTTSNVKIERARLPTKELGFKGWNSRILDLIKGGRTYHAILHKEELEQFAFKAMAEEALRVVSAKISGAS